MAPRSTSGRDSWRTSPRALFREVAAGNIARIFPPVRKSFADFYSTAGVKYDFSRFLTREVPPRGINSVRNGVWEWWAKIVLIDRKVHVARALFSSVF